MSLHRLLFPALALAALGSAASLRADAPTPAEAKLRDSLRAATLQLRTAESERSILQAAQAENEQKTKDLTGQVETLRKQLETLNKQGAADREASDKSIAALKAQAAERDTQLAQYRDAILKWKLAQEKAVEQTRKTEGDRAKLAAEKIVLDRRVADQQTKNAEMFKLGNDLLNRYEKFGLGDALTAREPFIGITRIKFENLIQDYGDKLADQKIKPVDDKSKPPAAAGPTTSTDAQPQVKPIDQTSKPPVPREKVSTPKPKP